LNEPENNVEFLDTAIQISDQEEINRRHEAAKIEKHISQILRANEIVQRQRTSANEERQRQRVEIKNQIESIQEVKKTLAKIDLDINKEKEVKKHDNKFKNFFGD
jgi:DNA-binding protein H-NS